jgi:hypothetical protein
MSDNIVTFPGQFNASRQPQPLSEYEGCSTGYGYARRNRQNPLRQKLRKVEIAVVEVNKVQYQHSSQELELIRAGVEAARILADDLAHAAEPLLRNCVASETKPEGRSETRADAIRRVFKEILAEEGLT